MYCRNYVVSTPPRETYISLGCCGDFTHERAKSCKLSASLFLPFSVSVKLCRTSERPLCLILQIRNVKSTMNPLKKFVCFQNLQKNTQIFLFRVQIIYSLQWWHEMAEAITWKPPLAFGLFSQYLANSLANTGYEDRDALAWPLTQSVKVVWLLMYGGWLTHLFTWKKHTF